MRSLCGGGGEGEGARDVELQVHERTANDNCVCSNDSDVLAAEEVQT